MLMDEARLRRLIECGDTAALHSYIHQSSSPLSQPLGAQARFAYFQIERESSMTKAEPLSTTGWSNSYMGPKTTVVHVTRSDTEGKCVSVNKCVVAECRRRLQSLEADERHARSRIESDFLAKIGDCHRWCRTHFDRCARQWADLFAAEHITRSAVAAEEIQCFRDILEAGLDDITGCRWDSVRMQWLRREMARVLTLHEWVHLHSLQPARCHTSSRAPVSSPSPNALSPQPAERSCRHDRGESPRRLSGPPDQRERLKTPSPAPGKQQQQQYGRQSVCARASRSRVMPAPAPEECVMS